MCLGCLGLLGCAWVCLGLLGVAWVCLGLFGCGWLAACLAGWLPGWLLPGWLAGLLAGDGVAEVVPTLLRILINQWEGSLEFKNYNFEEILEFVKNTKKYCTKTIIIVTHFEFVYNICTAEYC